MGPMTVMLFLGFVHPRLEGLLSVLGKKYLNITLKCGYWVSN